MKAKFVVVTTILVILIVIAFPVPSVSASQARLPKYELAYGVKECNDPKAPCKFDTFSSATSVTEEPFAITPYSVISTVTYTCGVNVYNSAGTKLATLSETATVRWRTDGLNVISGSRSTWVKYPSTTYWYEITGPSGIGSSQGTLGTSKVTTSARLIYTGIYDGTAQATLSFWYDRRWSCSSSYAK